MDRRNLKSKEWTFDDTICDRLKLRDNPPYTSTLVEILFLTLYHSLFINDHNKVSYKYCKSCKFVIFSI